MQIDAEIPFRTQISIYDLKTASLQQITKGEVPVILPIWSKNGNKIDFFKDRFTKPSSSSIFNRD